MAKRSEGQTKLVAKNKRAFHNFEIFERYEAGLVLSGTEIKSIRNGNVSLEGSFARVRGGEVFVYDMHIAPYEQRGYAEHEPKRPRKLLLHRREIDKLIGRVEQKGFTLVPLAMYLKRGFAKLEIGVARGKKLVDKREILRKRVAEREIERVVRRRRS